MGKNPKDGKHVDKLEIVILSISVTATIGIALLLASLNEETPIGVRFAILSANIAALLAVLLFSIKVLFAKQEARSRELAEKLEQIEGEISIDDTYKKVYRLEVKEQRELYLKKTTDFIADMEKWIQEGRSGPLSRGFYYEELGKAGNAILEDCQASLLKGNKYEGEIWAMTFWQDDELDVVNCPLENAWVQKMKQIDDLGIKTCRIFVLKDKISLLKRESVDDQVDTFLQRMRYYCVTNPECKNTESRAIMDLSSVDSKIQDWMNGGFFATKHINGDLKLIRGKCMDKMNTTTTLGGELDFDNERVKTIRNTWVALKNGAPRVSQYLSSVSSPAVKAKMIEMGFEGVS